MADRLPVWRSLLYVPTNNERFVGKAHTRNADAIILDLEDSIPFAEKAHARTLVKDVAGQVGQGGADVLVRINRPWRLCIADLEASVHADVDGLVLPKTDTAEQVRVISEFVTELEHERGLPIGQTRFFARIETARGLQNVREIATGDPRVVALALGAGDFTFETGIAPTPEGLRYPNQTVIIAARAAGILPLGLVATIANFIDLAAFREIVEQSRALGSEGAPCVHPAQVAVLNDVFRPTADEIDYARRVIDAYDQAAAAGSGATLLDGQMIDWAVVVAARRTLSRSRQIKVRSAS